MLRASANARAAAVVLCALSCFLLIDEYLYGQEGFLAWTGQATQEAQIVSKTTRAPALAATADLIAFGSSYVRSGLAGQPFWDRHLIPFNFGISGGSSLTSYFALKRIEQVLARRRSKPWLVLELKLEALERADDTLWAEYPQYLGIVRSRRERLAEAPVLLRHFRQYGMLSQLISSFVVPSGLYRSHAVQLLRRPSALDGYFYGMEDASGFAPLYGVPRPDQFLTARYNSPIDMDHFVAAKVDEIRAFLAMARRLECPVALYSSPSPFGGRDATIYDHLFATLQHEFPHVTILRTSDYGLAKTEFDGGGHPNLAGSDKQSETLIKTLDLRGVPDTYGSRLRSTFDVLAVPQATDWVLSPGVRPASPTAVDFDGSATSLVLAKLPPFIVRPGREYVIELRTNITAGELFVTGAWNRRGTGPLVERSVSTAAAEVTGPGNRIMLRIVPRHARLTISIVDQSARAGHAPSRGRLEILRIWGDPMVDLVPESPVVQ
jgi:hypothetical protein